VEPVVNSVPSSQPVQIQPAAEVVQPDSVPPATVVPKPAQVKRTLLQIAAPSSVTVGQQFSLDIKISEVKDLANAPFVLTFDPVFVDFVAISEGAFLKKDGKPTVFSSKSDSAGGTVTVTLGQVAGNDGVSGGGMLATVSFRAKNKGPASFAFKNTAFTSSSGSALNVLPFSTAVDIR
jgi:general secretion pathway protein D